MPNNGNYEYQYQEPPRRNRIGARIGNALLIIAVVAVAVFVWIATRRFSDETLALIAGLLIAGVPLGALALFVLALALRKPQREPPQQQMMMPPMVIQMPQQMPQQPQLPWYHDYGGDNGGLGSASRAWDVIGEQ